jgi:hypothetical protein
MNRLQMMGLALCSAFLYSATGYGAEKGTVFKNAITGKSVIMQVYPGDTVKKVKDQLKAQGIFKDDAKLIWGGETILDNFVFDGNFIRNKLDRVPSLFVMPIDKPVYSIGGEVSKEDIRNAAGNENRTFQPGNIVILRVKGKAVYGKIISPSPELPGYYLILTDKERDHDPDEIIGKL